MLDSTLYRDANYGGLILIETPSGVATRDLDFDDEDFSAVLTVLEKHCGKPSFDRVNDLAYWEPEGHRAVLLASVEDVMATRGYINDPLAERAIVKISDERAVGLPVNRKAEVVEVVERGMRRHLEVAFSTMQDRGEFDLADVSFFERADRDHFGRPLPFVRARGFLRRPVESATDVQAALREALAPVEGSLMRATVTEADGAYVIEVGMSPPYAAVEAYLADRMPTFESNMPIRGVRVARFTLNGIPSQEELAQIESRAASCTAATSLSTPDPRTVVVRIPSTVEEGDAASDQPFSLRVAWLAKQLEEWEPALDYIGGVEPVLGNALAARS